MTEATPARRGTRRVWFTACLWLHRWTSLLATPFFLVLCLSGLVLIFHDEVDAALGARPPVGVAPTRPLTPGALVAAVRHTHPDAAIQSLFFDPDAPDRAYVSFRPEQTPDATPTTVLVDCTDGHELTAPARGRSLTEFLLKLHTDWFLDTPGQLFGAGIAVLVLLSLGTGVIVYAPFVRRLVFGTIRRARGARIVQLDLHNLVGVVVLGWLTLVSLSGVMLGLDVVLLPRWTREAFATSDPAPGSSSDAHAPLDAIVAAAQATNPDREMRFVYFPGSLFSSRTQYNVGLYGRHRYDAALFDIVLVDARSGVVAATHTLPLDLKAVMLSAPLHFGNYGGLPLKLLWAASTLGALFITGNGAWLWWQRGRRRRHLA